MSNSSFYKIFKRINKKLTLKTKILISNSVILSTLNYCGILLSYANKNNKKRLQILQNKIIRVIFNLDKYTNTEKYRIKLKWLNIKYFIKFHILVFIHKIKLGLITKKLKKLLVKKRNCRYGLRNLNEF